MKKFSRYKKIRSGISEQILQENNQRKINSKLHCRSSTISGHLEVPSPINLTENATCFSNRGNNHMLILQSLEARVYFGVHKNH